MKEVRLSLCMIVRDNANIIAECLTSIRPFVDEMIVVDTGSSDDTPKIAASLGAIVSSFPWIDDFSAARNASLNRASGDWVFWMDSDDVIDQKNGRRLNELVRHAELAAPIAYVLQVHCPGPGGAERGDVTIVDHIKLFRNHDSLRFKGRIHEQILPAIRRSNGEIGWTDIHVVHKNGAVNEVDRRRKCERDIRILKQELAEQGEHPFVLFNLGMTYADMEEFAVASRFLQRSIAAATPGESHLAKAYGLLIPCLMQSGQAAVAANTFREAERDYPDDSEILFRGAVLAHQQHRTTEAIELYQRILTRSDRSLQQMRRSFSSRDSGIAGHKAHHNLAVLYSEAGRWDLAEYHWRVALDEAPAFRPALLALGEALIAKQKRNAARALVAKWQMNEATSFAGCLLLAKLTESDEGASKAIKVLEAGLRDSEREESLLDEIGKLTFGLGDFERARIALSQLAEIRPSDGAIHHNLGSVHLALGNTQEAIASLCRSLELRPTSEATRQLLNSIDNGGQNVKAMSFDSEVDCG